MFLIMDNIWTKLMKGMYSDLYVVHKAVSIFVHCDLDLSSLTLKLNRDHPFTMDNMCTCIKFDQDKLKIVLYSVHKVISIFVHCDI